MSDLHHECGIAAVYHLPGDPHPLCPEGGPDEISRFLPRMLLDIQNRGQLAAGMTSYNPDRDQLLETASAVATRLQLPDDRWSFAFQSESQTGEPWLGPDILDQLADLHARGVAKTLLAPIGFVADHLEVLYDLDIEAAQRAAARGLAFARTTCVNDDPTVLAALAHRVVAGS